MRQRITVHEDPDLTREHACEVPGFPSTVEVVLDSGATFMRRTRWPKGHPRNPLGDDELQAKFRRLVEIQILSGDHLIGQQVSSVE